MKRTQCLMLRSQRERAALGRLWLLTNSDVEKDQGRPRAAILRLPFAGELQGALADGFAEGLIRREGGEPCGLGLAPSVSESITRFPVRHFRVKNWEDDDHGLGGLGNASLLTRERLRCVERGKMPRSTRGHESSCGRSHRTLVRYHGAQSGMTYRNGFCRVV